VNLKANIKSAILQNDIHWVHQLIDEGADVNACYTRNGTTLLISAAAAGHIDIVKMLIDSKSEINHKTLDHYTAIMAACEWDHPDVADFLLENDADINVSTINSGKTTSFSASLEEGPDNIYDGNNAGFNNNQEAEINDPTENIEVPQVQEFKEDNALPGLSNKLPGGKEGELGANHNVDLPTPDAPPPNIMPINSADDDDNWKESNLEEPYGYTCLIYACANKNILLIEKLLNKGADINASTSDNESAISMACGSNHNETILMLIEKGANPNTTIARDGQKILMWAAENGQVRLVKLLLEKGADINKVDKYNKTALHESSRNGHNLIVRVLIEKGADINISNMNGETPLMLAAQEGHVAIVEELLLAGADPALVTKKGRTALLMAAVENKSGVVDKIISFKEKLGALDAQLSEGLLDIIRRGHTSIVRRFLDEGANPCYHNEKGVTALMEAAYNRENDIINLLLDAGADPNDRDDTGATALIRASYEWPKHLQMPDSHGPSGDVMVSGGHTSEAAIEDLEVPPNPKDTEHCSQTLKILLDAGANPNTYNNKGISPLSQRIKARDEKGIRTLIAGGVDSTKCTREGRLRTEELQILDNDFPGIAGLLKKQEFQGVGSIKEFDETGF